MLFDLNRYGAAVFFQESRRLWALALPMMLTSIASVGVGVADTAIAGGAGKDHLTAVALGSSVFTTVLVTSFGIMTALNPMFAQLHGAGRKADIGETGRQGLWFGLVAGVAGMLLVFALIAPLQHYLNLPARIETMLGDYLFYAALGLPAAMLHRALTAYTGSLNRPQAAMWVSWAALLLNIPLNYIFVYGKFGLPEMGGAGCGAATALVCVFNAAALGVYTVKNRYFRDFGLTARFSAPCLADFRQIWQLGWPIGLSYFLEVSLFACIAWLVADLGADTVAAQQIVLSICSLVYMVPAALGSAATVRIGYSLGLRRFARARYICGVSLALGLAGACAVMVPMWFWRETWVAFYTGDAAVMALGVELMLFAVVYQLFDFTQCIASYALRGYKITRLPMLIHAVSFWGLGLLPGWVSAYRFGLGVQGFWYGLILGLTAAAAALVWYLAACARHKARAA